MNDLWALLQVGLVLGGTVATLAGLVWYRTAKLLRFFGKEANPGWGVRVMLGGLAALAVGLGSFYLER
jgi:hypothetical protein